MSMPNRASSGVMAIKADVHTINLFDDASADHDDRFFGRFPYRRGKGKKPLFKKSGAKTSFMLGHRLVADKAHGPA
ncbi:MAG TPA: hypothetical protein VGG47_03585 [Acidocella sp.]